MSIRLRDNPFGADWVDWDVIGVAADRFAPSDRVRVAWTYTPDEYNEAIEMAMRLDGTNSAVYGCDEISELSARDISNGLDTCNSLLTNWLREEFPGRQDLHAKAIVHLVDILHGKGAPLLSLPRLDAWRELAGRPTDAVWRVCSRGKLG